MVKIFLYICFLYVGKHTLKCTRYNHNFTISLCHNPIPNFLKHIHIPFYPHPFHGKSPTAPCSHRGKSTMGEFQIPQFKLFIYIKKLRSTLLKS